MARRKRSRRKSASPPRPQVEYNTRAVAQRTPEEQEEALRLKAEAERRKAIRKGPLRCLPLEADEQIQVLWWRSEIDPIPIAVERALVVELLPRKHKEMGMMREKSKQEINRIKEIGKEYGINMATLCSLRRHHIKNYHLHKTMPELGLGRIKDINESARIFECAIFTFLRANKIACFTEEEQRRRNPVTPDFLMKRPVLLRSFRYEECDAESSEPRKKIIVERQIHCTSSVCWHYELTVLLRDRSENVLRGLNNWAGWNECCG